jgi:cell shape-determining protein MreC
MPELRDFSYEQSLALISCCVVVVLALKWIYNLALFTVQHVFANFESLLMFLTANAWYIVFKIVCFLIYNFCVKFLAHLTENNNKEMVLQHEKHLLRQEMRHQVQSLQHERQLMEQERQHQQSLLMLKNEPQRQNSVPKQQSFFSFNLFSIFF